MITGLIQPKKWKKYIALGLAVIVAATGTTCVILRTAPSFSDQLDTTAMIAAGFILPDAATKSMFDNGDSVDPQDTSSSPSDSAASDAAEETSSQKEDSDASSQGSQGEESRDSDQKTDKKTWSGTPYPIEELVVQNTGINFGNIYVKNDNDYTAIDIEKELNSTPDLSIVKDGTPQVLIYHTHTSESFLSEESDTFYSDMPTRSTNEEENVIAVGDAIAKKLEAAGIGVIHDTTIHDESYNGSYSRSAETIAENLEKYPTIQVTLDIHRDAMTAEDGTRYKPTVTVNGKKAAQIMIISGCDDDGTLGFPDWEYNLRFATRLQKACADIDGSFPRPLYFCPRNYNENMTHNSLLVEFGTEVNTIDEVTYSGELFGDALVEVLEQFVK